MAGTLARAKHDGIVANTVEDAIDMLYNGKYNHVIMYASLSAKKKLYEMAEEVYAEIRKRNQEIEDVDEQMLPVEPYEWNDIDGCLGVVCIEISMGKFKDSAGNLFIFAQPKYDCLTDRNRRKPYSSKAMTTLNMLMHIVYGASGTK